MASELFDRWAPVTRDMGLIDLPLEQLTSAFLQRKANAGSEQRVERIRGGLAEAFEALPPLSASKRRRLFVATTSGWTAQFQSGIQGSDPFPVMSLFARDLGTLAMRVCSTPPGAMYPAVIWEVYAPRHLGGDDLGYRRSIVAANDGGRWVFEESGAPFPFEDGSAYERPRKRDRFTRDMLGTYLAEFGLFPFRDDFYVVEEGVPAFLMEGPPWTKEPPEFTLEEVVAGEPWRHRHDVAG